MTKVRIPHDTMVLVADGRKALLLHNTGDATFPNLGAVWVEQNEHPGSTRDMGADKPGRVNQSNSDRRATVEQTDWHQMEEERFTRSIAQKLNREHAGHALKKLMLVAPARTLAVLRQELAPSVRDCVAAEIDKDLTHHPIDRIERVLTET